MSEKIQISYFSDTLCVWAYVAQIRLDELEGQFGPKIELTQHFIPIFGSTAHRIGVGWEDRGGFPGYTEHVREICVAFPHVELSPDVWTRTIPTSSAVSHHFIKAVQLLERDGEIGALRDGKIGAARDGGDGSELQGSASGRCASEELAWRVRRAFFRDGQDISDMDCLGRLAEEMGLPMGSVERKLRKGEAMAALCRDIELRDEYKVEGSPTYVLNQGRQKLYGNLGYRIIEANVQEILSRPEHQASWC
jgi:predicted DsbA family dithiol-disulfide isomerase